MYGRVGGLISSTDVRECKPPSGVAQGRGVVQIIAEVETYILENAPFLYCGLQP